MKALIAEERRKFHKNLLETIFTVDAAGIPSNADRANKLSILLAQEIYRLVLEEINTAEKTLVVKESAYDARDKVKGQTSGKVFEQITMDFLDRTFPKLQNLRPGSWHVLQLGNQNHTKTSDFAQYEHLAFLSALTKADKKLAAVIGNDYMVAPDVVVYRDLYEDEELNTPVAIVDDKTVLAADLRKKNGGKPILHASVSAKWTMRSDRAQNSRTEALNLIRNRKGRLPHIVVVTGEPTPSRIASLAMGTGDVDCVYHFALYELMAAVDSADADDAKALLTSLIDGKRLKDISDLPLDLSV